MSPAITRWPPYQSTTSTPTSGSVSSAGRNTASTAATSSAVRTTSRDRPRKRAESASPAPRPFTTRIPAIVSSASVVVSRELLLVDLRALGVAARVAAEADAEERQRREHGDREPPVDDEQHRRRADDRQHVADGVADRVEEPRHQLRVVRRAGDQLARADPVVVARVELERPAEDRRRGRAASARARFRIAK